MTDEPGSLERAKRHAENCRQIREHIGQSWKLHRNAAIDCNGCTDLGPGMGCRQGRLIYHAWQETHIKYLRACDVEHSRRLQEARRV